MQITAQISQVWVVPPCYLGKNACLAPHCCTSSTKKDLLGGFLVLGELCYRFIH